MRIEVKSLSEIALFTSFTAAGSFIKIPLLPVPVTLQTFFVYLSGDLLGSRKAAVSQALFLILGLMGIPVFSEGGGIGYIIRPTFGYLVSFPLAAWMIGMMLEKFCRSKGFKDFMISNIVGLVIIFSIGVVYLYLNINLVVHKTMTWSQAMVSGVALFLPFELLKLVGAALLAGKILSVLER